MVAMVTVQVIDHGHVRLWRLGLSSPILSHVDRDANGNPVSHALDGAIHSIRMSRTSGAFMTHLPEKY